MDSHLTWGFTLDSSMKMVISFCTFGPSHGVNEYMGTNIKSWFGYTCHTLYLGLIISGSFTGKVGTHLLWRWVEFFCLSWQMDPQKGLLIKWQTFGSAFPWWVRPWWFISVLTNQRLHTRQNTKQKHRRFVFHSYHQLSRAKVVGLVTKSLLRKVVENKTNVSQHLKRYHTICHFFLTSGAFEKNPWKRAFFGYWKNVSLR